MPLVVTSALHEEFYQDICAVLKKYEERGLPPVEILALSASLVGQVLALQDSSTHTPAQLIYLIQKNIESGNARAIQAAVDLKTEGNT